MNDNLAGQLWFGAECLAAGSSIMNKESESESMRPLAKAVTKSLEKVRALLREQCLSPQPEYTESIREHLKIFDRLFADFEFNYVRCMVHVKTTKEFELHQDLIVLFSETLMRAIKEELVTQDAVDYCDPSLMFAIPRLAIVYGLSSNQSGPLNVDRSSSEFPTLFLPFKNLLRKIRELLFTLEPNEIRVLEMLLCNLEEPANISVKLKEVQQSMQDREKTLESQAQALKLQAKLTEVDSKFKRLSTIPCVCDSGDKAEAEAIAKSIVDSIVDDVFKKQEKVEIDCTGPEIEVRVRQRHKEDKNNLSSPSLSGSLSGMGLPYQIPRPTTSRTSLKRHNARRDTKKIPLRYQKDRRAKFKSTEDLLHRLYVCISGAADQLQSNYAGDFRSILRTVFTINTSPEDDVVDGAAALPEEEKDDDSPTVESPPEGATAMESPPSVLPPHALQIDVGTDAMQHDQISKMYDEQLRPEEDEEERGAVYAQNLDLVSQQLSHEEVENQFYQPEPALLDIAQGSEELVLNDTSPREIAAQESAFYNSRPPEAQVPPPWIPDEAVTACMGCGDGFNLLRRRHHCRACGKVFCGRCSGHSMALPQFRLDRPVRVCNRCHVVLNPDSQQQGSGDAPQQNFHQRNFGMVS